MVAVKICGLLRPQDIEAVNRALPEYVGFVFAESTRKVLPEQAAALRRGLAPTIRSVGVFVNESPQIICALVGAGIIDMVQLHGSEDAHYIQTLKKNLPTDVPLIKAVGVQQQGDVQQWNDTQADFLLLDHKGGGTGKTFDWQLIGEVAKPYFLAGGLNVGNLTAALHQTAPFAVDVSSGVEIDGHKDPAKIQDFVWKVRAVATDKSVYDNASKPPAMVEWE